MCDWLLVEGSSKHSGRCQQAGRTEQSLSQAELTFAAQLVPTYWRPGEERRAALERRVSVSAAPGSATTYYVLGRMLYIMHAALTVIFNCLSLSLLYHVLTSVERERERDVLRMSRSGAVFGSLCTHTHSTPLHYSTPELYYMGATRLELHASLVGPHYSQLSSCKHCN